MEIYSDKKDWSAVDRLYQSRLVTVPEPCQTTYYAQLKLFKMGQYDEAIRYASQALERQCKNGAPRILAAAYVTKWAQEQAKTKGTELDQLLNKAQALTSSSADLIIDVASTPMAVKVLPLLKPAGLPIDELDAKGLNPLAYAAARGKSEAVENLIAAGADPHRTYTNGWTALMIAVSTTQKDVVSVLLRHKVDVAIKSKDGQTALSLAHARGNKELINMFRERVQRY